MSDQKKPKKQMLVLTSLGRLAEVVEEELAAGREVKTTEDWERVMKLMIAYKMVDQVIPVEGDNVIKDLKDQLSPTFRVKDL